MWLVHPRGSKIRRSGCGWLGERSCCLGGVFSLNETGAMESFGQRGMTWYDLGFKRTPLSIFWGVALLAYSGQSGKQENQLVGCCNNPARNDDISD